MSENGSESSSGSDHGMTDRRNTLFHSREPLRPHRRVAIAQRRSSNSKTVPPVCSTGLCCGESLPTFTPQEQLSVYSEDLHTGGGLRKGVAYSHFDFFVGTAPEKAPPTWPTTPACSTSRSNRRTSTGRSRSKRPCSVPKPARPGRRSKLRAVSQKSICTFSLANRAVMIDVGSSHAPPGMKASL